VTTRPVAIYPLTPTQEGILFHSIADPDAAPYLCQLFFDLRGAVQPALLAEAFRRAVQRHAVLRTQFRWVGLSNPVQIVLERVELPWNELDWSSISPDDRETTFGAFAEADRKRGLDLGQPSLLRVALIRLTSELHRLVLTFHHIVLDGWSVAIVLDEIVSTYRALAAGGPEPSFELLPSFEDYVQWLRKQPLADSEAFWGSTLTDLPLPAPLPCERDTEPRNASVREISRVTLCLSPADTERLVMRAKLWRITPSTIIHGAWALLLGAHGGRRDVVVGSTRAIRPATFARSDAMVGLFISTVPVRVSWRPAEPLESLLTRLQGHLVDVAEHAHAPATSIRRWSGAPGDAPLFDSIVVFENYPVAQALVGEEASWLRLRDVGGSDPTNYPLVLEAKAGRELGLALSYCVARFAQDDIEGLLSRLATLLAEIARGVPTVDALTIFELVSTLPRTASDKIERARLLAPVAVTSSPIEPPVTPAEIEIARVYAEVLRVAAIGRNSHFFDLGGDSLSAMRVVSRLRKTLTATLAVRVIFEEPTVAGLAARVTGVAAPSVATPTIQAAESHRSGTPLSYAQQRMWFLQQLTPTNSAYHMPFAQRLRGPLDLEALRTAFEGTVRRHEALRTRFPVTAGTPVQDIVPAGGWELPLDDLSALTDEAGITELQRRCRDEARTLFDLTSGPLVRTRIFRLAADDHVMMVTMHHIISDGWSMGIFWREVAELYNARTLGRPVTMPSLKTQYADYAALQRNWLAGDLDRQLAYWKHQLASAPAESTFARGAPRANAGDPGRSMTVELDEALTAGVRELAKREGATVFMVLLAALHALLYRATSQQDLCIGTPVANRNRSDVEGLIGLFVNTVVLRTQVCGTMGFAELLRREREVALEAFAHEETPFEMVVDALGLERSLARSPLFQVFLVHQNMPVEAPKFGTLVDEPYPIETDDTKFDLSVYSWEHERQISLELVCNASLFTSDAVARIAASMRKLLESALADPTRPLHALEISASPIDPRIMLEQPVYPPVLDVIEALAKSDPSAPALRRGGQTWTRRELWHAIVAVAEHVVGAGIAPGHRVAVGGVPSFGLIVSLLGVMRARACAVPMSSWISTEHQRALLARSGAVAMVWASAVPHELSESGVAVVGVDPNSGDVIGAPNATAARGEHILAEVSPRDAAYVYFTSGTTGAQKGVLGTHSGLAHFLAWQGATFGSFAGAVCAQLTHIGFDVFLRDVLFPLTTGKVLTIPPHDVGELSIPDLFRWLDAEGVTAIHTVPSLARAWLAGCPDDVSLPSLRCIFIAGEPLPGTLVSRWRLRFRADTEFINLYGPTETTLAKCWYRVPANPGDDVQPIGTPLPHTQVLVLGENGALCGCGEPGELVIRTPFRTRGYLESASPEARRFRPNPFRDDPDDIVYYTGDRGAYRDDGMLAIFGRADDQVKIRGQRIDPTGLSALLTSHADVADAAVTCVTDEAGETRLAAYVVRANDRIAAGDVRRFLRRSVPHYMVPSAIAFLPALPCTPNGKLDRTALPAPVWELADEHRFTAPRTAHEATLVLIWAEILGVERVGIHDDFFALGGHSLLATQLVARIRRVLGAELPLRAIFEHSTVAEISGVIAALDPLARSADLDQLRTSVARLSDDEVRRAVQFRFTPEHERPMTALRESLVEAFAAEAALAATPTAAVPVRPAGAPRLASSNQLHVLGIAKTWRFQQVMRSRIVEGNLDVVLFARALDEVVQRHEPLRTRFQTSGAEPTPIVDDRLTAPLRFVDLRGMPENQRFARARDEARHDDQVGFDLERGPVLRCLVARLEDAAHLIVILIHHVACDGPSFGIFFDDLIACHDALVSGHASPAPLPYSYSDFAYWQRRIVAGPAGARQLEFWSKHIEGATPVIPPSDRPYTAPLNTPGTTYDWVLDDIVFRDVQALARREHVTVMMVMLSAFTMALREATGQEDICFINSYANRDREGADRLIGYFTKGQLFRMRCTPQLTRLELLRRTRDKLLEMRSHSDVFMSQDIEVPPSLIRLNLNYQRRIPMVLGSTLRERPMPADLAALSELPADDVPGLVEINSRFDLAFFMVEQPTTIGASVLYRKDLYDELMVRSFVQRYVRALKRLAETDGLLSADH
jgi:amino acid adenylation domain-containing protein